MNATLLENNLTHELELLICCSVTHINEKNLIRIESLLQKPINWEYILEIAAYHKVLPLLFINLSKFNSQAIPHKIFSTLQKYYYLNTQHSLLMASKLVNILNIFTEHNIPVIPFKGPILATIAYGDISRRSFGDLDLLVHREDFINTKQVLINQGFEPYADSNEQEAAYLKSLNSQDEEAYLRSHWELHLINQKEQVTLDVHQGVLSKKFSLPYSSEWIWNDTITINFAGKQILSFSAENLIIILCSQGSKDCWLFLNRICDLAEVLRTYTDVNWEKTWQLGIELKMTRMLLLGLSLAHHILDTPLPEMILQKIESNTSVKHLTSEIIIQLTRPVADVATQSQLKSALFHLKLIEQPWDKILYCYEHLIVPTIADKSFVSLPKYLSFFYYFIRPFRMIFNMNKK
ncbi:nucleotidyltransferase family protein [Nostoc spongiaeforme FACHB-130]|uniref:Nucleotidyltransferase family protein n=1 Tax=Nostoc spongiaeforme FACHB-130 TaxID=1357510 RepID=A0ABR8FV01_9NOSO|nr:nucleotidyltransferase family protein [Nostoc spongiaeforme]MBD2594932.1 nucleotidyltransferase family protein [Nostoc spongiaeforme FACHB-130]